MRLLDLFCGAGGAAMGYHRAGFEVVGVDINPQPNYPFEFAQGDALTVLDMGLWRMGFDVIHASPPCQGYSTLRVMPNAREHPLLVERVRGGCQLTGLPYVIENVVGAPLLNPLMLCGSMFGLQSNDGRGLRRHRLFEIHPSSLDLSAPPCVHPPRTIGIYGEKARDIAQEKRHYAQPKATRGKPIGVVLPWSQAEEAMDIDWMTRKEMCESIPPAYTAFIGRQLIDFIASSRVSD